MTIATLVSLMWGVSVVGFLNPGIELNLALIPRATDQWWGIFTNAFVHQDILHLLANTAPLVVFLVLLQIKGNRVFFTAVPLCLVLSALPLWFFGRGGAHIGASGLVFALFGFLIANACFSRRATDFMIALAVALGYWGLIGGLLPRDPTISWDGHLAGMIGGIFASWWVSRQVAGARRQ
ncbi:MAG: rhomboid family intramembrane serine protease [Gammaproteobacteria bacterium]|nr:rhomboid family intramembrane serine protease [Gammaproteobacteria bacterium]